MVSVSSMVFQYASGSNSSTNLFTYYIYLEPHDEKKNLSDFNPPGLTIQNNEVVKWIYPKSSEPIEPHTITFVLNGTTDIRSNFSQYSQSVSRPNLANKSHLSELPYIIYSNDSYQYLTKKNLAPQDELYYNMTGEEKYINSGLIFPKETSRNGSLSVSTFAMKFDKPGIYEYRCLIHPESKGLIVVKSNSQSRISEMQNE